MPSNKQQNNVKTKREFYALVIVTIPTILMAVVSQYIANSFTRALAQILLFFMQAVIVKGMLENRYTE